MAQASFAPGIGREYDPFLFAAIGEDKHGQLLSVISALARSNLDPWEEAVGLARMSRDMAATRLSRLISALPCELASNRSPDVIADELIALLPRGPRGFVPPLRSPASPAAAPPAKIGVGIAIFLLALMVAISLLFPTLAPSMRGAGGPHPRADENAGVRPSMSEPSRHP